MKKIIATVLAMVMALALCSTAFAATTVKAKAYQCTDSNDVTAKEMVATFHSAVAPKLNKDGKQTNTANVAYYEVAGTSNVYYVAVDTLAKADLVLYSDAEGDNVMLYLDAVNPFYNGTGTKYTNIGNKCGQVDLDTDETYYTSNAKGNSDAIYVADDDGTVSLMVSGKLVKVKDTTYSTKNTVSHSAIPTVDATTGKVTGYTCSDCKLAAVKAANIASIPDGAQIIEGKWYFPVSTSSSSSSSSSTSPKTFDAGIAMYVGMALTSVAGSAVVIGKKKEF